MAFDKMGPGRRFHDVVVVRGAFDLCEGHVTPSSEQSRPILADQWWNNDNAPHSSLKEAGDILLCKPGTDVFVTGVARVPAGQMQQRWFAGVVLMRQREVLLRHMLELTGPRYWQHSFFRGWHLSNPEASDAVPLRYELAYGGVRLKSGQPADAKPEWETYKANPSGTGFFNERMMDRDARYPGPQIEDSSQPIRSINKNYPLTGFGPVARFWQARSQYAGTYDAKWREQFQRSHTQGLAPDFPPDFDMRFYQCAPTQLVCRTHLRGDECIGLGGMLADPRPFSTLLPALRINAHILAATQTTASSQAFVLDTVHVDLDTRRLNLSWRLTLNPDDGIRHIALEMESLT